MSLCTWTPVLVAALALPITAARAERYSPRVGQRHPELTLPSLADRSAVSLAQFRGRKVLLVHFASW
jgi:hypothetical protein